MRIVDFTNGRFVVTFPRYYSQARKQAIRKPFRHRRWWNKFRSHTTKHRYSQPGRANPYSVMAELRTMRRMQERFLKKQR